MPKILKPDHRFLFKEVLLVRQSRAESLPDEHLKIMDKYDDKPLTKQDQAGKRTA